jgi:hypothetical protein
LATPPLLLLQALLLLLLVPFAETTKHLLLRLMLRRLLLLLLSLTVSAKHLLLLPLLPLAEIAKHQLLLLPLRVTPPLLLLLPSLVQVTTKKGYDGCRKAEYLYAREVITDKTFASLGETTISNLKATFDNVQTGGFRVQGFASFGETIISKVASRPQLTLCARWWI